MYFTKNSSSYRAWFSVIDNTGILRPNIISSSFTATIINQTDTLSLTTSVTQSSQKLGLYRFDIPSSFLLSGGIGDYGICVEINQIDAPSVIDAFSNILQVTQEDFDSISGSIWSTLANSFNISGTMGYQQNQIGATSISASVAVDVPSIVSGVWNANAPTFNSANSVGGAQNKIFELSSSLETIQSSITFISTSIQSVTISTGSIAAVVDAVWNEATSLHTQTGSFGVNVQNLFSGSILQIVSGVWDANNGAHLLSGSTGLNLSNIITKVTELHQLMGLELGSTLTVTPTSRTVAGIDQTFSGDPAISITVERI